MKNIFIGLSHGFQVRNFIQTPFISALGKEYNLILLTPEEDSKFLKAYIAERNIKNCEVIGVSIRVRKIEYILELFRKYVFVNPKRIQTKNIMNELSAYSRGRWWWLLTLLNQMFGPFEFFRSFWRFFESLFVRGTEFDQYFEQHQPYKVITADYGTRPFEIRLLRSAKRKGSPTLSIVPSWDNMSSKGVMGILPDKLAVWNEIMKKEAIELHAYDSQNIEITGPVQFDNFFINEYSRSKEEFLKRYDIKANQPVIVYGTITPKYFKYNFDILNILKENILSGEIIGNPKVIIRVHPQVVKDPVYGDNLDDYKAFAENNENFALSVPEVYSWASFQVPDPEDYKDLITMLQNANVCIASASTLIFDSLACNTPFVGIGLDGYEKISDPKKSVRRMFDFDHYSKILDLNGFSISESITEFVNDINACIKNRDINIEGRAKIIERQIKFSDGKNHERAISMLK